MGRMVDVDDLIDAQEVARLLGLKHRTSVATYQRRYPLMPRPVVDLSASRTRLWLRSEVAEWEKQTRLLLEKRSFERSVIDATGPMPRSWRSGPMPPDR
jgi:hypothetical protein